MTTGLALLRLVQLFDSQFPIGSFAHSGGLETYAASGAGLSELRQLLHGQIELGWGRSELGAAFLAWSACDGATLDGLARQVDALKVIPATRNASAKLGRRTLDLLHRLYPGLDLDIRPSHHAVVVGAAARQLGVDAHSFLLAYGHSLTLGTLSAAMRCMPVSPAQAQELLIEMHPPLERAAARAAADPQGSLFTCTPALDIRSHQQAFLHTRLFQS